jgi:hypothetical protein
VLFDPFRVGMMRTHDLGFHSLRSFHPRLYRLVAFSDEREPKHCPSNWFFYTFRWTLIFAKNSLLLTSRFVHLSDLSFLSCEFCLEGLFFHGHELAVAVGINEGRR